MARPVDPSPAINMNDSFSSTMSSLSARMANYLMSERGISQKPRTGDCFSTTSIASVNAPFTDERIWGCEATIRLAKPDALATGLVRFNSRATCCASPVIIEFCSPTERDRGDVSQSTARRCKVWAQQTPIAANNEPKTDVKDGAAGASLWKLAADSDDSDRLCQASNTGQLWTFDTNDLGIATSCYVPVQPIRAQ